MLAQTGERDIYIVGGTNALCTVIKDPTACPWDPGVCNKDVEVPAELLRNQVDVLCDLGLVRDVDFIRLAYARGRASVRKTNAGSRKKKRRKKETARILRTNNAPLLRNGLCTFNCLRIGVVPYRHVGTRLGEGVGDCEADPRTGTRDDGGLTLQREQRQHRVSIAGDILRWHCSSCRGIFAKNGGGSREYGSSERGAEKRG